MHLQNLLWEQTINSAPMHAVTELSVLKIRTSLQISLPISKAYIMTYDLEAFFLYFVNWLGTFDHRLLEMALQAARPSCGMAGFPAQERYAPGSLPTRHVCPEMQQHGNSTV